MAKSYRILVVDDEYDVREMIEVGLELEGHSVITAEDGERALEVFAAEPIDLVITDIKMPGMGGIAMTARMREIAPDVRVVVVTGYLDPGADDSREELRRVQILRKPFAFGQLAEAVRSALDEPPDPASP